MQKRLIILAIVLVAIAAALGGLATFWTEYEWFAHLNFGSVYITRLIAKLGTGLVFGVVALATLLIHVHFIRKFSKPRSDWKVMTPEGEIDLKDVVAKLSTPVVVVAAVLVAAAMGYWASMHWEETLKFLNQTSFDQREPILGKDIGFYLFELPLLQFAQTWLIYLVTASAAGTAAIYLSREAIIIKGYMPEMSPQIRSHLLVALAAVAVALAWGYRIEMFETLFSKRGVAYGATYTDVKANLHAYRILIGAHLVGAVFLLVCMRRSLRGPAAMKQPAYAIAVLLALYALGVFAWPTLVQRFVVNPNELEKERPYLALAIAGTRRAYALDRITAREFPADQHGLDMAEIQKNSATIDNVKIWADEPLRETYRQLQVIRLYYDFVNTSVDRYHIGDQYRQVMLSARELVHDQLPPQSQTWVNRHLQYTHGYGVCLSPVNQSTDEGLPDLWIKDIPPEARYPDLKVDRPEIYYGMKTGDYVLVKTTTQEFDYPKGDDNVYTTYQGKGGVRIGGFLRRLLFAIRFADVNLLFTEHIQAESRVQFNRHIQQRVATVAPFLMLDREPYATIANGRLYWIQDAYTISYRYPYSQPTKLGRRKRINYVRNSVKVVVDAFHGTVSFYVWDEQDPMIKTYAKIFPEMFKKRAEMPPALRQHVRYPKDLFTIQASMYESFHMTDARVFYNQEDKWSIARKLEAKTDGRGASERGGPGGQAAGGQLNGGQVTEKSPMLPYYMIMKLPEENKEEFLLMLPYTPSDKDNMVAWMTARCDGDNYGKLQVYNFPKQKLIFGPLQFEARIDQNDHISQWITLRNQQGSSVIRGDLLVIPIEQSLLYVEPIYLQSTQTKLPELKQVIVAFDQRLAMRPTLAGALEAVFGADHLARVAAKARTAAAKYERMGGRAAATTPPAVPVPAEGQQVAELAAEALRQLRSGERRLASGDWAGYGETQTALKRKLERLSRLLGKRLKPRSAASQPASAPAAPASDGSRSREPAPAVAQ